MSALTGLLNYQYFNELPEETLTLILDMEPILKREGVDESADYYHIRFNQYCSDT